MAEPTYGPLEWHAIEKGGKLYRLAIATRGGDAWVLMEPNDYDPDAPDAGERLTLLATTERLKDLSRILADFVETLPPDGPTDPKIRVLDPQQKHIPDNRNRPSPPRWSGGF